MGHLIKVLGSLPIEADPRWSQIVSRDRSVDGLFWYSVATTGVFCRPSCPSRRANPRNVAFHASAAAAVAAGFRACRRCDPLAPSAEAGNAALVEKACALLDTAGRVPSLKSLAEAVELSPAHFHRLFKAATGVTPRAYAAARRAARLREGLGGGGTVTEAIYGAGFGSAGRFYAESAGLLGMTPGRFRAGGGGETLRFAIRPCSLGSVLVAMSERGVAAILLGDDPDALLRDLQDRFPAARLVGGDAGYERLVAAVVGHIEAPRTALDLPLDIRGTAFQQRVWEALRAIPPGQTASYADIAGRIGAPKAVRAVAGACASNALAVAIPCHRVVRGDGALSGYRWGVVRKRALLDREAEDVPEAAA